MNKGIIENCWIILLLLSIFNVNQSGQRKIIQFSTKSIGDVYLVSQSMILLSAYECSLSNTMPDINSPLGFLAGLVYVQNSSNHMFFWNTLSGGLILSIQEHRLKRIQSDIELALKINHLNLEQVFNELVGINNLMISSECTDLFMHLCTLLAETFGVGCDPTGLMNLNSLMVYKTNLPPTIRVISKHSPLKQLASAEDLPTLVTCIAESSVILDCAARYNTRYLFIDSAFPMTTLSGLTIGNLIGDKNCLMLVDKAVLTLLLRLSELDVLQLATELLVSIATTDSFALAIKDLYAPIIINTTIAINPVHDLIVKYETNLIPTNNTNTNTTTKGLGIKADEIPNVTVSS